MRSGAILAASAALVAALATLLPGADVAAEAPAREELASDLLVTRSTYFINADERYDGIWRLDPDAWSYSRMRPFASSVSDAGAIPPGGIGGGEGHLSVHGNVLTYRTFPSALDFDLLSWRLLRRIPLSTDPSQDGWILFGPELSPADAESVGLRPGVFGFGRCLLKILTQGHDWDPPSECGPWPFPEDPSASTTSLLLWEPSPSGSGPVSLASVLADQPWTPYGELFFPVLLDPDAARGGVWRSTPTGFELLPVIDGSVGSSGASRDLELAGAGDRWSLIPTAHFHPDRDRFFGVASGYGAWAFVADAQTGVGEPAEEWPGGPSSPGVPNAMTSLGAPPAEHVQLVPIVGGGPGARGTDWTTQLWLYNPASEATTARLRRVTRPEQVREVAVPARGSERIDDLLGWLGAGAAGDGTRHEAVVVTSPSHWAEELVVFGRISTPDSSTDGRFGHALPAVPGRVGYSNHYEANVPNTLTSTALDPAVVELDLRPGGRYRVNLGVTNDLDEQVSLRLEWGLGKLYGSRPPGATQHVRVPPHAVRLVALESLFPAEVRDNWPPRIAVWGRRPAALWVSIVDNVTGDATFVPFTTFMLRNGSDDDRMVLPVAARLPGEAGTRWQTDLLGLREAAYLEPQPLMAYRPTEPATACGGEAAATGSIEARVLGEVGMPLDRWLATLEGIFGGPVPADWAERHVDTVFRDVVGRIPGCADDHATKGALEVAAANWTAAWSRTSTTRADGGTYGGMLPLYPPGGWPVQHFAGVEVGPGQRVNLGLYNGVGERAVDHRLELHAADGRLAAERTVRLEPHEHAQRRLEQWLGAVPDGLYGLTVTPLDDPDGGAPGRSWAYVSLVDERTGDPVNLW